LRTLNSDAQLVAIVIGWFSALDMLEREEASAPSVKEASAPSVKELTGELLRKTFNGTPTHTTGMMRTPNTRTSTWTSVATQCQRASMLGALSPVSTTAVAINRPAQRDAAQTVLWWSCWTRCRRDEGRGDGRGDGRADGVVGVEPWLATWRPLATTGDLLATNWRPTGDLATGDPATRWQPPGDLLATTGDTAPCSCTGDHWRPLATAGDLATWRPTGDLAM